ncbi:MAG: DNA polymerase I [Ruminococcaceae bacterium]|nr:DNA polymerase I [Oscillospiraceae bacterium]
MKTLLCIDGNSILNRSFYGIRLLTTKDGVPTNALYGLTNIISRELERLKPDYAAIAYDLKAPTFRHKMYDGYKAGRHAMPDELRAQMPVSREFAEMLGLHILDMEGYEADDILGTLAAMAEADPEDCMAYLLTGDKDSLQLISPKVHVLLAGNNETADTDETAFMAKYGVRPDQFVDVKALMGDSSDNIPGVPGIGEKTALKLIAEFGSLDGIYEQLETAKHTPSVRKKLTEGKDSAYLSQALARIFCEVPLGLTLEDIRTRPMNRARARELFIRYEFSGFIKRFGLNDEPASAAPRIYLEEASSLPLQEAHHGSAEAASCGEATHHSILPADLADLPRGRYALTYEDGTLMLCREGKLLVCSLGQPVEAEKADAVKDFLDHPETSFITYDAKNLYHRLNADGIPFEDCDFDVMLAAYALNSGLGSFDLDRISVTYLGNTPPAEAICCYESLCDTLTEQLSKTGQWSVFRDVEMPLAAVLYDMERIGFKVDRESIYQYGLVLDTYAADLETRIFTYSGKPFNINSPKQLGEILFETLMLPADKKTKTGYSTSAEVLEKLRKYHPIVDDILEYRQVTKLKSTYVEGLLKVADEAGLVHTTFKQTGTATGRLSSAEPNLQNIPIRTELGRELRKFFIPTGSDRVLIDADYSQIELRLLADIAGDSAMREAFVSGFDIHTDTASRIFGVGKDRVTVEQRKQAKAVNFGIMYGMGEHSLSEDLHITRKEAKEYIDNYLNSYPDVNRYLDEIVKSAYEQGFVTTKLGRRRFIPELSESNKMRKKFGERVAMNSPIQGTAADIIKLAMIRVRNRLKESGLDAKMILQVHDELILEASRSDAEAAMLLLREEMENAVKLSVPLDVEAHIGESWFEAH